MRELLRRDQVGDLLSHVFLLLVLHLGRHFTDESNVVLVEHVLRLLVLLCRIDLDSVLLVLFVVAVLLLDDMLVCKALIHLNISVQSHAHGEVFGCAHERFLVHVLRVEHAGDLLGQVLLRAPVVSLQHILHGLSSQLAVVLEHASLHVHVLLPVVLAVLDAVTLVLRIILARLPAER